MRLEIVKAGINGEGIGFHFRKLAFDLFLDLAHDVAPEQRRGDVVTSIGFNIAAFFRFQNALQNFGNVHNRIGVTF